MQTFAEIETANGGKYPGFAVLRVALSVVILLHHSRVVVRGPKVEAALAAVEPSTWGGWVAAAREAIVSGEVMRPALYALVGIFFFLSGFLVAGSAARLTSVRTFLAFRALRIVPALVSEVTLSAIVLGGALTTLPLADYYSSYGFWRYFGNIAGFVTLALPGVFEHNPIAGVVNENLWTLTPEFYCYFALAVLMGLGALRSRRFLVLALIGSTALALAVTFPGMALLDTRENTTHFPSWFIVWLFLVGVIFNRLADVIPFDRRIFAGAAALYFVAMWLRLPDVLAGLCLAYVTASLGVMRFPKTAFFERHDYSYGIYLYGFPIAQTLVLALAAFGGLHRTLPVYAGVMATTLVLTTGFAALSWRYVEKPVLAWKRFFLPAKPVAAGAKADAASPARLAA